MACICEALVVVQTATVPGSCIPCKANPFELLCGCKGGRKIGLCSHILLVTHEMMKTAPKPQQKAICNLVYMTGEIAGKKKKIGGAKPHKVKHCLLREDSDDDDEVPAPRPQLKW